ncbi:hypothetical protein L6Q21_01525 [Sandaracinobacter sp. RS1-74]|uniref:hypothetical protein n=1 Tax=Sandaracinobacteroides sayramensis TaxID=2913411 RepID=UPI001EDB5E64|nr:hypothetical protein [Sandaracinobacteroides sayramensis]MCG2839659.1 hypothetical protein [Sandaracinobacteroides sayramensis]
MPIKKPKQAKLPMPFAAQELSHDDDARRRAILIKRELEQADGFSWNAEPQGFAARIRNAPRHKLIAAVVALGMAVAIVSAFLIAMDSGIEVPERVVYMESWDGNRTSEDALRDQAEAMDRLRAQVEANRRAHEAEQARQKALEAERAAARQATS